MKRGIFLISLFVAVLGLTAAAQVPTTTVADTVYYANGTPAQGTIVVSWSAFTTANGAAIAAGSTSVTLGTGANYAVSFVSGTNTVVMTSAEFANSQNTVAGGTGTAAEKMAALTKAGVKVVKSPADMGSAIKEVLGR